MLNETVFYIGILMIVSLVILLTGLLIMFIRLLSKYQELKKHDEEKSDKVFGEIMNTVTTNLKTGEEELSGRVQKMEAEYSKAYNSALERIGTDTKSLLQNMPQDIKTGLFSVVQKFAQSLSDENKALYQRIMQDLEKYKAERMKQIDVEVTNMVKDISQKVLGKSISLEEHEEIIKKALEDAKKEGII